MARLRTRRSLCRNPPLGGEDELAGDSLRASIKGNNTPTYSLAVSWAPTFAPPSIDELFKRFMKAYFESNQEPRQPPKKRKQSLKAKVLDVYYGKLQIDCYYFCQQYEDHFETSRVTETNRTLFAVFFLCENISVQCTRFKHCQSEKVAPIIWIEFKSFLQKNLGESKSFVNNIWKKLKRDSQY